MIFMDSLTAIDPGHGAWGALGLALGAVGGVVGKWLTDRSRKQDAEEARRSTEQALAIYRGFFELTQPRMQALEDKVAFLTKIEADCRVERSELSAELKMVRLELGSVRESLHAAKGMVKETARQAAVEVIADAVTAARAVAATAATAAVNLAEHKEELAHEPQN
jgi:hypothetical protein